jgi:hypothetical protein
MDNHFFRQCFPYKVACTERTIEVYNRQYEKVFEGYLPKQFDKINLFSTIAADRPDCIRESECFLYDDQTCPVANEKGLSKTLFKEYEKRLIALLEFMCRIDSVCCLS